MRVRTGRFLMTMAVVGLLVAGCGDDGGNQDTGAESTASSTTTSSTTAVAPAQAVRFVEPTDGATVVGAVKVRMEATGFTLEPAGEVKEGAGHLHIIVDGDCVAAGQVIQKDDTHLHYGMGQTEAELTLAAGSHTLCLQAGDGAHTALDLTDKITIEVANTGY